MVDLIAKLSDDEVALLVAAIPVLEHLRALDEQDREPSRPEVLRPGLQR
jgi:hypothetical protein